MALTPGGRSPSTQPRPSPPSSSQPPGRNGRRLDLRTASASLVRWSLLIGGLVIIADLAAQALSQRAVSQDDLTTIDGADQIINYVLFSVLGIVVVRDTGLFYLGAIAGVLAALLDAIVVAAAASMAPPPGGPPPIAEYFARNLAIGIVFAGLSGAMYGLMQRWARGQGKR